MEKRKSQLDCDVCGELKLTPFHRCRPLWLVKLSDDGSDDWTEYMQRPVRALSAAKAAEEYAIKMACEEGGEQWDIEVINYPAVNAVKRFIVYIEMIPAAHAVETASTDYLRPEVDPLDEPWEDQAYDEDQ